MPFFNIAVLSFSDSILVYTNDLSYSLKILIVDYSALVLY